MIDLDRAFKVDPEGTSARFSPDFVLVDHRHLFQLEGGVQHIRDIRRSGDDAGLRSMGTINRAAFVGRSVVLVVQDAVRRAAHGGDYEWTAYLLAAFDSSLRLERLEYFAEEDWEVALARFDELSTAPDDGRSSRVENAVTRRRAAWAEMLRSGRFDEARARLGEFTTEDVVCVDRRPTVAAPDVDGAGVVDSPQAMYELGLVEVAADPIAVRGERLALFQQVFRSPGGDELVILNLQENDASNRAVFVANYGEDQLAEAHDELNARFVAGEARAHRDLITTALAALDARQRGDFEELQRYLAADLVMNDHQQLGLGAGDLDLLLAAGRAQHSVARTAVDLVVSALVASHTLLAVQRTTRTSETGAEYLWRNCVVVSTDAAGLLDRIEWFDEADWDRARSPSSTNWPRREPTSARPRWSTRRPGRSTACGPQRSGSASTSWRPSSLPQRPATIIARVLPGLRCVVTGSTWRSSGAPSATVRCEASTRPHWPYAGTACP